MPAQQRIIEDYNLIEPLLLPNNQDVTLDPPVEKDIVLPKCWSKDRKLRINHNVFLNLALAVLYGIAGSLWCGTAYAAYVQKLGHGRNGPFGEIEAVFGLATLITALPVGYLADRWGRSKVITAGGFLLLVATLGQTFIIYWTGTSLDDTKRIEISLWLLGGINVFWGLSEGVVDGPCAALFADSTRKGERSRYYNYLFVCSSVASAVGPLVSIVLFHTLGDDWSIFDLRTVIFVGLGLEFFTCFLMLFFDDKKALEDSNNSDDSHTEYEPIHREVLVGNGHKSGDDDRKHDESSPRIQDRQKWIPYIIFAQDIVSSIGSGMTIKFFPLFFKDDIGMSPSRVQCIFFVAPLMMAVSSSLASRLASSGFGRVQTRLLFSVLGVSCLYTMVFFKSVLTHRPLWLVPIYVVRTSLMNGTQPLQESILMDFVPKNVRGRWKSLDALASVGWCGSAALGGWLADRYDYTRTFLVTAILQSVAICVWALLLPLVPRVEGGSDNAPASLERESLVVPENPYYGIVSFKESESEQSPGVFERI